MQAAHAVHIRTCRGHAIYVHAVSLVSIIMTICQAFFSSNTRPEKTFTRIITIIHQSIRKQLSPAWTTDLYYTRYNRDQWHERTTKQSCTARATTEIETGVYVPLQCTQCTLYRCRPEPYWDTALVQTIRHISPDVGGYLNNMDASITWINSGYNWRSNNFG